MTEIFYNIFIIFAMILIGYISCKAKVLSEESNKHLISLLINVTSPCMILTSITSKTLDSDTVTATVQMLAGTVVYFAIGALLAVAIAKLMKVPEDDVGVYSVMLVAKNTGFMGFPVSKAAFGNEGLFFMVLSNIILNLYIYSAGMIQVGIGGERRKIQVKGVLKSAVNMCSIAAVIAVAMLFLKLRLPGFLEDLITPIGDATIPISMLVLGVQLAGSNIAKIITKVRLVAISAVSVIVWPALTFLAVNWLPLHTMVKMMMIYASAFPTMVMIVAIASHEGKNAQLAAEGVALTTLFSVATLPAVTTLLSMYYC